MQEHQLALTQILRETAEAHHQVFHKTDGKDEEWPLWYANYMHERIVKAFEFQMTKSELVQCLLVADTEHRARAPRSDWAEFYAELFIEHFSLEAQQNEHMALYYFSGCPFCMMVIAAIETLDIDVEMRNILESRQYRDELIAARGRSTVPVLRITTGDEERWMPESRDIIRYLEANYG